jgi:cellobiose phosphorylase
MAHPEISSFVTPKDADLGLKRIANEAGMSISALANGAIFSIEHEREGHRIMVNQLLGSPLHGGIGRLILRLGGTEPRNIEIIGPAAKGEVGAGSDRIVWRAAQAGIAHETTLWLHPHSRLWLWRVELTSDRELPCDVVLVQDVGLGERAFLMGNEAYASQYIDHHIELHPELGPVVMCRQNLEQGDGHPWMAQGCLDGAASFSTDGLQLFGPQHRDAATVSLGFGTHLAGLRLQHEVACIATQSREIALTPGKPGEPHLLRAFRSRS